MIALIGPHKSVDVGCVVQLAVPGVSVGEAWGVVYEINGDTLAVRLGGDSRGDHWFNGPNVIAVASRSAVRPVGLFMRALTGGKKPGGDS